jgi:feruloyl esterase
MKKLNLAVVVTFFAVLRFASADAADCSKLASLKLPHTEITLAQEIAAGAFKAPPEPGAGFPIPPDAYAHLPAFCRVAGTSRPTPDSDIRFEVWLPASSWNGKFVGTGNGVWAGSVPYFAMVEPLMLGYATMATDDGHQGSPLDASFAAGHPEKLIDFGHRAVHETTVVAKEVIAALYGKKTQRSLFVSCSTGGRQGLMEAYRYPADYEGISSMAPANPMTPLLISSLWTGNATLKDSASRIPPPKFAMIHQAVLQACDANDGVKDGIVSAPGACKFDPAALQCKGDEGPQCLTAPQIAALRAIYQGPRNPRTGQQIHPGFSVSSEPMFPIQAGGPEPFPVATTYMRSLVFKDPKWYFTKFDYDKDAARAIQVGSDALDVPATGIDKFIAGGGRLLMSHGWADGLIPAMATVNFYSDLTAHLGVKKADSTRLFMIPGMGHCAGGEGPFMWNAIATLDNWVTTGKAPERIVASNPPGAPPRTRPLCPWPQEAQYSGAGSTDEEKSFKCAAPAR